MIEPELFIGITDENELVSFRLGYNNLNKGTKWYNPHYSLSHYSYRRIVDDETGEQDARDTLEDEDYWKDLGYLGTNVPGVLTNNINWEEVADDVINSDGWYNTNGEWCELGEYEGKEYFIDLGSIGFEEEHVREKFTKLFISENDFKYLTSNKEWKQKNEKDTKEIEKLKKIMTQEQDIPKIIEACLEVMEEQK